MLTKLKPYEQTVGTQYAKLAKILDPRFTSNHVTDDLILRPFLQSTYPLTANVTDEAINRTSNFLLDVMDYGTEPDSVDEISKFLQATAIRDRNANPLDW